jgi:hypothetical protein
MRLPSMDAGEEEVGKGKGVGVKAELEGDVFAPASGAMVRIFHSFSFDVISCVRARKNIEGRREEGKLAKGEEIVEKGAK